MTSTPTEPLRPRGGLRRLRRGASGPLALGGSAVLTKSQFATTLQSEIERAIHDELTLMVMRLRFHRVPVDPSDQPARQGPPEELIESIANVHDTITLTVVGPSELMLLAPSLRRRPEGKELVAELLAALSTPVVVEGHPHRFSPRIGAAMLDGQNPTSDLLIDGACLALDDTEIDEPGKMFNPYQRVQRERRRTLESDLRNAVLNGEITSALQPAFDLETGRLVAVEAFARWNREAKQPTSAFDIVTAAEEVGLGHLLGQQVLERSLSALDAQLKPAVGAPEKTNRSAEPDPERSPITLWINVTPEQITHPGFVPTIHQSIDAHPAITIGLELSPSPPVEAREVHAALKRLYNLGTRIAIGDFGIGNANLHVLRQLLFDSAKLDRALLRQVATNDTAAEMVGFLIDMARLLGLEITGQGIENQAQATAVADLGCDIGQGFFYAEPSDDPAQLAAWLAR